MIEYPLTITSWSSGINFVLERSNLVKDKGECQLLREKKKKETEYQLCLVHCFLYEGAAADCSAAF